MKFLKNKLVMIFLIMKIILSVIWVFCCSNMLLIWVGMELKFFSALPVFYFYKNKFSVPLYYSLMSVLGSVLFLVGILFFKLHLSLLGLMLKLGLFPFFWWVPYFFKKLKWMSILVLGIMQKMMPLFLISGLFVNKFFLLVSIMLSIFFGMMGFYSSGYNLKLLLGWSSLMKLSYISGLVWLGEYSSVCCYFFLYVLTLFFMLLNILYSKQDTNFIESISSSYLWMLILFGLPPFVGFLFKVIFLYSFLIKGKMIIVLVLLSFMYLQIIVYMDIFMKLVFLSENYLFNKIFGGLLLFISPMFLFF